MLSITFTSRVLHSTRFKFYVYVDHNNYIRVDFGGYLKNWL